MKTNVVLLFLCSVMSACVYNEELVDVASSGIAEEEADIRCSMPTVVDLGNGYGSQDVPDEALAHVKICIKNRIPDMLLTVEGIRICNVRLKGTYHPETEHEAAYWETDTLKTSLTVETGRLEVGGNEETLLPGTGSIPFIPQRAGAWDASELPGEGNQCYLLLDCKVCQIDTLRGRETMLWSDADGECAEVAIPLSLHLQSNRETLVVLTMAPNCPWYDVSGTSPQALFVPIVFDAGVEDWQAGY